MSIVNDRPMSADTMVLVLKPREEDYRYATAQLAGTENEVVAYRKNRLLQMKHESLIAEIQLRERTTLSIINNTIQKFQRMYFKRKSLQRADRMLKDLLQFQQKNFGTDISSEKLAKPKTVQLSAVNETVLVPIQETDFLENKGNLIKNKQATENKLPSSVGSRERRVVVADLSCCAERLRKSASQRPPIELPTIKSTNVNEELSRNDSNFVINPSIVNENKKEVSEKPGLLLPGIIDDRQQWKESMNKLQFNNEEETVSVKEDILEDKSEKETNNQQFFPRTEEINQITLNEKALNMDLDTSVERLEVLHSHKLSKLSEKIEEPKRGPSPKQNKTSVLRQQRTRLMSDNK